MSENNQDIYVFLTKTTKECMNDFIKYYLENSDSVLDSIEDDENVNNFALYEYESCVRDHNSSNNVIKPQFSFLFPSYYLTIMIDLSSSMFTTTNDGDVKIEKAIESLKDCLYFAVKSYSFNNTTKIYNPNVIINILCFNNNKIIVIIKGWQLKITNFQEFFALISKKIYNEITAESKISNNDTIFNIIRDGIISLNLMENNRKSMKHLLIITDGQYSIDDGTSLDRCICLLRYCFVCCSFIHIQTSVDSPLSFNITDQGNEEQLKLLANCTGGFYKTTKELSMNLDKYILRYRYFDQSENFDIDSLPIKSFTDRNFNIPPTHLIFTIINMGYILHSVNTLRDSRVEIELILPWRIDVSLKISIISKIPFEQHNKKCSFSLMVVGSNYLLHEVSKSLSLHSDSIDQCLLHFFRGRIMKCLKHSLYNIENFSQFNSKPIYIIPNFINNGLKPMLSPTNQPCDKIDKHSKQFFDFWTKTLEFTYLNCFHTTNINILLEHDYPFPDFLSTPDPVSNKYSSIQGRESLVQLNVLINKNFCTFTVKENNTYVKFFYDNTTNNSNIPIYFCVLKMCCQGLTVELCLYFFITTPEKVRDDFVSNLTTKICSLKFQPRGKQARPRHMSSHMAKSMNHVPPQQRSWEQINCCTLLSLDLSNLIAMYNPIRYIDPQNNIIRRNKLTLSLIYLHNHCYHDYRIWVVNEMFRKNIFESLIKIRLQEGFHIAASESASGFMNLVKEIELVNNEGNVYKCFIQYLIYPDNNRSRKDSDNISANDDQLYFLISNGTKKITTEIFIERKHGKVINTEPEVIHWEGLVFSDIPDAINDVDLKSIETFVTFECFKIYPMTLQKGLVKPNICSVLNKSPRFLAHCPLFTGECRDNYILINSVFMSLLDKNLKWHGFNHIDITKTENSNFNKLVQSFDDYEDKEYDFNWNCYYMSMQDHLLVIMIPGNYVEYTFQPLSLKYLPIFVHGMSLKHLSFLIEDSWTLKLPNSKIIYFPLKSNFDINSISLEDKVSLEFGNANEFAVEMEKIFLLLGKSIKKLESIYLLTFVGGVHKNLIENYTMVFKDLNNAFSKYCKELLLFEVDATKFINNICSHCNNALKLNHILQQSSLGLIIKENCEVKANMHNRIVTRIRQMMAKYFKEVPSFPHILIYCPGSETESEIEYIDIDKTENMITSLNEDISFCRQKSEDNQCHSLNDTEYIFGDCVTEVKSVSSIRLINQNNLSPLFISINYTIKYGKDKKHLKFDNIPTCISDFIDDMKTMVDGDIDFQKLKFNLDMIPITYINEDLNNLLTKTKSDDQSLTGEVNSGSKRFNSEITKRYLTPIQTQLLDECKIELVWTLEDEVVNCLKYSNSVDGKTIDIVKKHIENTSTLKLQKNFSNEIQKRTFDLEFVFKFEKSKLLFNNRFEKIKFGKCNEYRIEKIEDVYCVFQKKKICPDQNAMIFPDQTFEEMEEIYMQSRLRVDSLCITSLQTASDNLKGDYLRRCSSEGKLSDLKSVRKMCESKRESVTLFDKVDNQISTDIGKFNQNAECRITTNTMDPANQYIVPPYNIRQYRCQIPPNCQQSNNPTPKRHRSGEASSIMYTGNYRSDTPMLLNDLVSTATSSKGYEGDSSRVSEGEEYDHYSNCPTDIRINNTVQDDVAPFWLLLEILEPNKQIVMYFHHTDTCTMSSKDQCEYCSSIDVVCEKIKECVHEVNQCLLLEQLAQTRICSDILVSEDQVDKRPSHGNQMYDCDYVDENTDNLRKFGHGTFACPIIVKITFKLHPRLKGNSDKTSKAIPILRMSLENIVISNRKNMLIFVDENTNGIFYSLLNEVSKELNPSEIEQLFQNSVLISEQNENDIDVDNCDTFQSSSFQLKSSENYDNISIKSAPVISNFQANCTPSLITKPKTMDLLELSVHGVDKLSEATIKSIIANIGSKLDSIVLRQMTDSICRCSSIGLVKEDLDFLLGIDYNNKPQNPRYFFQSLPKLAIDHLLAFCYYLKQNLQTTFISPKFNDTSLYDRFNLSNELVGEVYLYNQPSAQGVANDAIVLFTVQLISAKTSASWIINDYSIPEYIEDDDFNLASMIEKNRIVEIGENDVGLQRDCCVKLSFWLRGQASIEGIKKKIHNIIQYSINDLFMEFVIIPRPISTMDSQLLSQLNPLKSEIDSLLNSFDEGQNGVLQRIFSDDLFSLFPELSKLENPLIKHRRIDMFSDFNVEFLINNLMDGMNESIGFHSFSYVNDLWSPWDSKNPKSGKEYPGMKKSFILIGRMEELWKRFVSKRLSLNLENTDLNLSISQSSQISNNSASTCPRKVRMLLKQQPYEISSLNSSMTSSTSTLYPTNCPSQNLPEFCHVQVQNTVVIPRQMLCIVKIVGCQIDTISYNLVKDALDNLNNLIDTIVQNHKHRFQMLNSFIYQKLGLFHESTNTSCFQSLNINVVKNLSQISKVKNINLNLGDINRDRKPSGSPRSFSPSNSVQSHSGVGNQNKPTNKNTSSKRIQLNINITRIYQDPYTIFSISDVRHLEYFNDMIYHHATQFLNTYTTEMKRRLSKKKIRQCITLFQPRNSFNQSENSDILCPFEQLEVFSSMKRACRIFHSVVCPILFIPYVRKKLLNLSSNISTPNGNIDYDGSSNVEEWMTVMSTKLLSCYAEYVQKEQGFQFVNPPRPNISQNPCSHALFQKCINNSGIYLMEIFILKGCLCVRLSAFEYRRFMDWLPGITPFYSFHQPVQQPQKTFVKDACKLCDLTHLYSFIYDFYVMMVVKSITNPEENKKYFNVISFLRDFVKMYSYPPMYACNHIYWMPYSLPSDLIKPNDLFDFLVRHYEDYDFSLSHPYCDQSTIDPNRVFMYNISNEPVSNINLLDVKDKSSFSSSPLSLLQNPRKLEEKYFDLTLESDFTTIFCLTKSNTDIASSFDLFVVTFNKSNSFPHQQLIQIKKIEPNSQYPVENYYYPAKYLSILPHKRSSPDNMLHLHYCPITYNSIDTDQLPNSLSWKTFDNRSVVPLQVPLFLTLRCRIENYELKNDVKLKRAITDCHKDSLWHRMYQKPESSEISLQFLELQDLINSGEIVDILELDPRLVDSMKIATSYVKELNRCMPLLSNDCRTILYENASAFYKSENETLSTHLVLLSKNTTDGFLLLSKTINISDNNDQVELKAVFRSQDCRNRISPQIRYFSSSLRDVTVMLAETAAFCIWRKLTEKL